MSLLSQKRGISGNRKLSMQSVALLLLFGLLHPFKYSDARDSNEEQEIVRAYEIRDPAYCWLTPAPFICRQCLEKDERIVQILTFSDEGRPTRSYRCQPWKRKYLY